MSFQVKQELVEPELKLALGPMPMTSFTPPQSVVSSSSTSARRKSARHEREPTVELELDDDEFVVEDIIARSLNKGYGLDGRYEHQYLVRWQGYGPEDDTWEMGSSLRQGAGGLVTAYELRKRKHEITIVGQKKDRYHVRYSGPEGTATYSPLAEKIWQTTSDMRKAGLRSDQIAEAIRGWETKQRQMPTPPKSERESSTSQAVDDSPGKRNRYGARYLSRQLVKILDMQTYRKSSSPNQLKTRFRVVHKLVQSTHRKRGLQTREEWYTATHLANTFSRPILRAKIKDFMPALLPDENQAKQEQEVPVLNEYEEERQRMMKQNAELMKELGLAG